MCSQDLLVFLWLTLSSATTILPTSRCASVSRHGQESFQFFFKFDSELTKGVLLELAKWRVPTTVLADTFREFTVKFKKEWKLAVQGTESIYVTMTWSEGLTVWNIAVGEPELFMLDDPTPKSGLGGPASAIVINLTRCLHGLRF